MIMNLLQYFDPGLGLSASLLLLSPLLVGIARTSIEWTDESWNFVTGCDRVSAGCWGCYMFNKVRRLKAQGNPRYLNGAALTLHTDKLDEPLGMKNPRQIFVNSMSDFFHEGITKETIYHAFDTMLEADHHVYQILTKRGQRLAELGPHLPWRDHIWMGVSVENDEPIGKSSSYAPTDRIDDLRQSGAAVKWISAEPLIGPLPNLDLTGIDWMVIGGESGPLNKVRPMKLEWVRDLIRQCRYYGVPVFVKQLGTAWAHENGLRGKGGQIAEWPADLQVREQPQIFEGQPTLS